MGLCSYPTCGIDSATYGDSHDETIPRMHCSRLLPDCIAHASQPGQEVCGGPGLEAADNANSKAVARDASRKRSVAWPASLKEVFCRCGRSLQG